MTYNVFRWGVELYSTISFRCFAPNSLRYKCVYLSCLFWAFLNCVFFSFIALCFNAFVYLFIVMSYLLPFFVCTSLLDCCVCMFSFSFSYFLYLVYISVCCVSSAVWSVNKDHDKTGCAVPILSEAPPDSNSYSIRVSDYRVVNRVSGYRFPSLLLMTLHHHT